MFDQKDFRFVTFTLHQEIKNDVLDEHLDVKSYLNHYLDTMVIEVRQHVFAEHLESRTLHHMKTVTIWEPRTWWDMFKYHYRGRWWMRGRLRRWNLRKITRRVPFYLHVQPMLLFPEYKVPRPSDYGKTVRHIEFTWE